ncbi:hypothetical protein QTH97_34155 [Variovorax sp. J22R24]|uniref:hypothetical protein n=1 Tax=Variovorax gracilis TaxID=3053502 RepID=UPI002577CC86|nr:hypothetical protein [Variovorax sp. J22R24]MDM0109995.1 hypothetical protein [Variovorax sp. J22R24]
MKKLILLAALAIASLGAHAQGTKPADNPALVRMGQQAVVALTCAAWARYMIHDKVKGASYAEEATRLRAYGLKTGRAFIDRIKEVTKSDAYNQLPSYYSVSLDYSQGTDFALGQLTNQVDENAANQFKIRDAFDKVSYDPAIWRLYASKAYSDRNCDLIGRSP